MALAMVRCQLDYNRQETQAFEGSWERYLTKIEPGDTLKQAFENFSTAYISGLATSQSL